MSIKSVLFLEWKFVDKNKTTTKNIPFFIQKHLEDRKRSDDAFFFVVPSNDATQTKLFKSIKNSPLTFWKKSEMATKVKQKYKKIFLARIFPTELNK